MNIKDIHMEIAKERFLEIMASNARNDPKTAAVVAVDHADKFAAVYMQYAQIPAEKEPAPQAKQKGCRACHGSGGKMDSPCLKCYGTGKVPA